MPAKRKRATAEAEGLLPPTVDGEPPAWANFRSELGDTLPWFRAVQGGIYHKDGLAWGVLISRDSGERSYIDEEVVITRIGGSCSRNANGDLVRVKDQEEKDLLVKCLLNSMEQKVPVGIIIGEHNTVLGKTVPHPYNVMDYFRITNIWFECIGKRTAAKVRYEKLDLQSKSWWADKGSLLPPSLEERDFTSRPNSAECNACSHKSFQVFHEGWMCLQPSCTRFFKIQGLVAPANLTYHQKFLRYRMAPDPVIKPHHSLIPDLLSTLDENDATVATSRVAWKGIICPQCRKCISRKFWRGWKCSDDGTSIAAQPQHLCTFEKMTRMPIMSLRSVIDTLEIAPQKRAFIPDDRFMIPEVDDNSLAPYRRLVYIIPRVGHITQLVSNRDINDRPNGPNTMFTQLQLAELGLKRFPLSNAVVPGTLTAHFAGNPYKYVAPVNCKGFDEAPGVVLHALGRLQWATEKTVHLAGHTSYPPNEILVLGYFADMKIGYHDDGETSLGPTIATLSLGSRSIMQIRMKSKYYKGKSSRNTLLENDPVLPGCAFQLQRQTWKTEFERGMITQSKYDQCRNELFKSHRTQCEAKPCIKLDIHHGDMVVMHGESLQRYYEHEVVPENKLRFALTARHIKAEHVDPKDTHKGDFMLAGSQLYNGI
ncbi:2OG-Fe(II) oxygenase superfamily-domain-containing protein [Aspergillus pseudotamarii]|uniref:2OG-Fe(II) oxygenase superfamily-domain-containing protein n=1 Tax=Aspergillus pseudotamarii TaxID=132259 RepID=A0A5N6SPK9_ASPPS|nr:2OG-Fe(II) oxygenase superfamily-domain-containing protein [Aspergillus pseudotamarii]KAE8136632.1 2OG-Fe(II) oxygenase superfamily-domain-containing protein [Aspergillus pseudotamarii]